MSQQQLFASFLLDKGEGLEIALRAETVAEATPLSGPIQRLPSGLPFIEGLMHLRREVIPLVNLKKRLGLPDGGYGQDAKVAVVQLQHRRFGLLFDDIKDVFAASPSEVVKLDPAMMSEDRIISSLINRDGGRRTVELLDLGNLFPSRAGEQEIVDQTLAGKDQKPRRLSRHVVFAFAEQLYGVPVQYAQEITFFDAVEQMYRGGVEEKDPPFSNSLKDLFKHSNIDGALTLRGRRLPVLNARRLLSGPGVAGDEYLGENTRILVVSDGTYTVGLIVEEVKNIETIAEDEILPVGGGGHPSISGVYQRPDGGNVLLLDMDTLIEGYSKELKALARLTKDSEEGRGRGRETVTSTHHLITENCYLIFRAGKNLAVRLKDVQEIIDKSGVLGLPGESGFRNGVINLRGTIVPVVNLRAFYGFTEVDSASEKKLILCRGEATVVALEVDCIVTIHKQEQYQATTSVKKELTKRKDTLDRMIVYQDETGASEHVLVVNVHNLIRNHLAGENL